MKFRKFSRLSAELFFAAFVLSFLFLLSSCQESEEISGTVPELTGTVPESGQLLPDLPVSDYGGYEFRILVREDASISGMDDFTSDLIAEEFNGDVVNDAVYTRNLKIQNDYNIKIIGCIEGIGDLEPKASAALLADEDAYDIIVPHAQQGFSMALRGFFVNWLNEANMPYTDLSMPWWSRDSVDNFTIKGKYFIGFGDISYQGITRTMVMMFNKDIFDDLNIAYPYESILNGSWTCEKFESTAKMWHKDLNGDGSVDFENDSFGLSTSVWVAPVQLLYSAGQRLVKNDGRDRLSLSLYNETTVGAYEWFFDRIVPISYFSHFKESASQPYDLFVEGRAIFMSGGLMYAFTDQMRSMEDDYGIIPNPKYGESTDGYPCLFDAGSNCICVPVTSPDTSRTSVILEALAYEGYKNVFPAVYDTSLQNKISRDEQSVLMLELIKENRVYDVGYFTSPFVFGVFGHSLMANNKGAGDIASYYASNEALAVSQLETITEAYENLR